MSLYAPPVRDSLFVLDNLCVTKLEQLPASAKLNHELLEALIGETGRFCGGHRAAQ